MKKRILILTNNAQGFYSFRKEIIQELIKSNYEVFLSVPYDFRVKDLESLGANVIETAIDRRGNNPIRDVKLLLHYHRLMKTIKPDLVLTYTIKPNIYGGLASRLTKTNIYHAVVGLGSVYLDDRWIKRIVVKLNKIAFANASKLFFLNEDNAHFYKELKIVKKQHVVLVPGSGVDLKLFKHSPLKIHNKIIFCMVARLIKDKGVVEYLEAAKQIRLKYPDSIFNLIGPYDDDKLHCMVDEYSKAGFVNYLGSKKDIYPYMEESTCVVLPSYGEGRGTVLQEGAAVGRPLITTNTFGCKDNVVDGYNGYLCEVACTNSLVKTFEKYITLSDTEKILMGQASRDKAETEFDRNIVIDIFMNEILN